MTAVAPLEVPGTSAGVQQPCWHQGERKPVSDSGGTRAAVTPPATPATGYRGQGTPIGGGTSRRRRDAGAITALGTGNEGGGTHVAVQTEARPSSVETGVGTGSWGGTCDAEASAVVDSREQGTCTHTAALAHAGTQADDDQRFSSFEEVADYCSWWTAATAGLPPDLLAAGAYWPPPDNRVGAWRRRRETACR